MTNKETKGELLMLSAYAIFVMLVVTFVPFGANFMHDWVDSRQGNPSFPEGCIENYAQNVSPSGIVSADKEYCYTKVFTGWDSEAKFLFSEGRNTYERIRWERE